MDQLADLVEGITLEPTALLDIALTALLIYGLLSLIQGTRAVRLVIGAIVLYLIYVLAQALELRLLSGIMQTGAVVGLLALVVVFQPELRRALERIGRFGSFGWVTGTGSAAASAERVDRILAAAAVLPLSEAAGSRERLGTRHRAALGITEQTDAIAVVVSEETGRISLMDHGRAMRDLDEDRLRARLVALLRPADGRGRAAAGISAIGRSTFGRGKRPRVLRRRDRSRGGPEAGIAAASPSAAPVPAMGDGVGSTGPDPGLTTGAVGSHESPVTIVAGRPE